MSKAVSQTNTSRVSTDDDNDYDTSTITAIQSHNNDNREETSDVLKYMKDASEDEDEENNDVVEAALAAVTATTSENNIVNLDPFVQRSKKIQKEEKEMNRKSLKQHQLEESLSPVTLGVTDTVLTTKDQVPKRKKKKNNNSKSNKSDIQQRSSNVHVINTDNNEKVTGDITFSNENADTVSRKRTNEFTSDVEHNYNSKKTKKQTVEVDPALTNIDETESSNGDIKPIDEDSNSKDNINDQALGEIDYAAHIATLLKSQVSVVSNDSNIGEEKEGQDVTAANNKTKDSVKKKDEAKESTDDLISNAKDKKEEEKDITKEINDKANNSTAGATELKRTVAMPALAPTHHTKSKAFDSQEENAIDEYILEYCGQKGFSREDFCDRIWSNGGRKDDFWVRLCQVLPHRTRSSIYKHVRRRYHIFEQRGKWTPEEDTKLKNLCLIKEGQWSYIGQQLGRMPEDCRDRWRNYLKCGEHKNANKWTKTEEEKLVKVVTDMLKIFNNVTEGDSEPQSLENKQADGNEKATNSAEDTDESATKNNGNENIDLELINQNVKQETEEEKDDEKLLDGKFKEKENMVDENDKPINKYNKRSQKVKKTVHHSPPPSNIDVTMKRLKNNVTNGVNWTLVSEQMGGTRSRIQCRYKWNSIIEKEAINILNNFGSNDIVNLLNCIKHANVDYFHNIDWDDVANKFQQEGAKLSPDMLKACFKRMRRSVKIPESTSLAETLDILFKSEQKKASSSPK
ncbi:Nsi1p SCDLUD_003604 [Saccharomycodes ludwigii]|uniref:Nsi1p n=1 Tax=Saccharomycodes ludwigii TaxID=36035 RepID=UPI001E8A3EA2|nr:hypothetical protein SCDLUD_003604 [Saccharomycodes ludwigii]KAH3900612.1 hypothetical protein SCDLUD_003604 [Saccharomycodes ludwigii]